MIDTARITASVAASYACNCPPNTDMAEAVRNIGNAFNALLHPPPVVIELPIKKTRKPWTRRPKEVMVANPAHAVRAEKETPQTGNGYNSLTPIFATQSTIAQGGPIIAPITAPDLDGLKFVDGATTIAPVT